MGNDKGLLLRGARTWSETALDNLRPFCARVVLSVNESQAPAYGRKFSGEMLLQDDPAVLRRYAGPLAGVLTAGGKFPDRDLLVLACDMSDMDAACLTELVEAYRRHPYHSCYAYRDADFFEPLCAIYTSRLWNSSAEGAWESSMRSLQDILRCHTCYGLPLTAARAKALRNYNHPARC
jgi:molybdopterin-guanine dinucleotide biosynthesis protein A